MLEGVNIIQTIVDNSLNLSSLICIIVGCLMFAGVAAVDMFETWKVKQRGYALGMLSVIIVCFVTIGIAWNDSSSEKTKYIVTIDDSVNFNEFMNQYEILETNGKTYTVQFKTNN